MPISDYSTTADNNISISSINIAEGCMPSNVNNAIRQLMADLAQYIQYNPGCLSDAGAYSRPLGALR